MLNNRELASVIIIAVLVGLGFLRRGFRSALPGLVRAALTPKLSVLWIGYATCIGAAIYGLRAAGLDYDGATKDAIVWALVAGLSIYVRFDAAANDPGSLWRAASGALRVTALVEFFVNLYVFPLWVELPVQSLLFLIGLVAGFVNLQSSTPASVRRLFNWLATASGILVFVVVLRHLLGHWSAIDWRTTLLSFVQPLALTLAAVLATAVVAVISAYESAFTRLPFPSGGPPSRLRHRLALILGLHLRLRRVSRFAGALTLRLRQAATFRSALRVVRDYRHGRTTSTDWAFERD